MDSGKSWSNKNFVSKYKDKEITLFWSHRETQLYIIQGTLSGKRKKGRPKATWLRNIIQWTDIDLLDGQRTTQVNGEERSMVWSTLGSRMTEVKSTQVKS